jgi:hypothetical protein
MINVNCHKVNCMNNFLPSFLPSPSQQRSQLQLHDQCHCHSYNCTTVLPSLNKDHSYNCTTVLPSLNKDHSYNYMINVIVTATTAQLYFLPSPSQQRSQLQLHDQCHCHSYNCTTVLPSFPLSTKITATTT